MILISTILILEFVDLTVETIDYYSSNAYEYSNNDQMQRKDESKATIIYPGTKWCGPGNIAANDNDLGTEKETDSCCREHDMCSDVIEAGQTKYGLTNNAPYTRLNCSCDEKFHRCLHRNNSTISNIVGIIYFDLIRTKCFAKEHPIIDCTREYKIPHTGDRRCKEYSINGSEPPIWQWFDVPAY